MLNSADKGALKPRSPAHTRNKCLTHTLPTTMFSAYVVQTGCTLDLPTFSQGDTDPLAVGFSGLNA
jgi:hypothetical protein